MAAEVDTSGFPFLYGYARATLDGTLDKLEDKANWSREEIWGWLKDMTENLDGYEVKDEEE